jgi:hypothetical protein
MSTMPQLKIADLLANAPGDPEAHLDATRFECYAEIVKKIEADTNTHDAADSERENEPERECVPVEP